MSQPWDFPGPAEDPGDLWKDLKDAVLPKHEQTTANDLWADLKTTVLPDPKNKDLADSNDASIPKIKVTPTSNDSNLVQSSNEGENEDTQVEVSDASIDEIEVAEPTFEANPPPTSDESEYADAQEELDTPSISEPKIEQEETKTKEKSAPFSNLPFVGGFESSDMVDFLSLGDNAHVREKLLAILMDDEPGITQNTKPEDHEPKLKKQRSWLAEVTAALKSGTISKNQDNDGDGGKRELRRIRTELDHISRQYEPKASNKGAQLKKRHSWAADTGASPRLFTPKGVQTEKFGDTTPTKQSNSSVRSDLKAPKSARSKRSNSWAAEIRAILKSADFSDTVEKKEATESDVSVENIAILEAKESISAWLTEVKSDFEPISTTEVTERSGAHFDERNDSFENTGSAHVKSPSSYWTLEVRTPFALTAVTKSHSNREVMNDQVVYKYESHRVEKAEPGRADELISAWIAEVETSMEEVHELNLVPDDESGTDDLTEKQEYPVVDSPKKPNWVSPNLDAFIPMDGPNPTISWDFWHEEQRDTSKFKDVAGDWCEDLPCESLKKATNKSSGYRAVRRLLRRRSGVSTDSSPEDMGMTDEIKGPVTKKDQ